MADLNSLIDLQACESASALVVDLVRLMIHPESALVVRVCLARTSAQTLDEFIPELICELLSRGIQPFEGSELAGGRVRLGPFDSELWAHGLPEAAPGPLCDPDVWPLLAAAFSRPSLEVGL